MIPLDWHLFETGHCLHPEASSRIGASWRACEFPSLVALLRHPRHGWILFDTGYGQAFMDATRRWPERLYRAVTPVRWRPSQSAAAQLHARGIEAASVAHVVISHFHGDHVGALADFPAARVWCDRTAWHELHGRHRLTALAHGLLPALAPQYIDRRINFYDQSGVERLSPDLAPFHAGHDLFGDGSVLAVPLPGHATGHFGVCFRGPSEWVFLVGDAAWSSRAILDNLPPPRWATGMLGDTEAYRRSLAALHALAARGGPVRLVPAHCREARR